MRLMDKVDLSKAGRGGGGRRQHAEELHGTHLGTGDKIT